MEQFSQMIATALKLPVHRVENTLKLLQGGATIPFISRYRKEATGGLDEVQIGDIHTRYEKLCELAKRKETVLSTIEEQGKLTDALRERITNCWDTTELEDIYLPLQLYRYHLCWYHYNTIYSRHHRQNYMTSHQIDRISYPILSQSLILIL